MPDQSTTQIPTGTRVSEPVLRLENLSKSYDGVQAVKELSAEVGAGQVFALLGPSGCGKTTTLRMVAGLENPDEGEVYFEDGLLVSVSRRVFVPPHKRNMGMVFQSYAIWPHMTVFENVAYPLKARGVSRREVAERVEKTLALVGLQGLENRPGPLLSGGEQQRVAVARALVYEPKLLLLDEPFSNLDTRLREQVRLDLKLLQRRVGIAVLFVTHDLIEALSLADRLGVMNAGVLHQVGTPEEVYQAPVDATVRDFLGRVVLIPARVVSSQPSGETHLVTDLDGQPTLRCRFHGSEPLAAGTEVTAAIRPDRIRVFPSTSSSSEAGRDNTLSGEVVTVSFLGDAYECYIRLSEDQEIVLRLSRDEEWKHITRVTLQFPEEDVTVWPKQ